MNILGIRIDPVMLLLGIGFAFCVFMIIKTLLPRNARSTSDHSTKGRHEDIKNMEEDKAVNVKWGITEGVKFGFGFGFGIFLWIVLSAIVSTFVIWLFVSHAMGVPAPQPAIGNFGGL